MCEKEKFSKKSAKTIINHAKKQNKKWRREKRCYFCDVCEAWHVTSKEEYEEIIPIKLEELSYKDKWMNLMK